MESQVPESSLLEEWTVTEIEERLLEMGKDLVAIKSELESSRSRRKWEYSIFGAVLGAMLVVSLAIFNYVNNRMDANSGKIGNVGQSFHNHAIKDAHGTAGYQMKDLKEGQSELRKQIRELEIAVRSMHKKCDVQSRNAD